MTIIAENLPAGTNPTMFARVPVEEFSQSDVFELARNEILPNLHSGMVEWYIGKQGRLSRPETERILLSMIDSDLTGHIERWPILSLPVAEEVVGVVSHHPDAFPFGVKVDPLPLLDSHTVWHMQTGLHEPLIAIGNDQFQEGMLLSVLQGIHSAFEIKKREEIEVVSITHLRHQTHTRSRLTPGRDASYSWRDFNSPQGDLRKYIQWRANETEAPLLLIIEGTGLSSTQTRELRDMIANAKHVDAVFFLPPIPETNMLLDAFPSDKVIFGEGSGFKPDGIDIFPGQFLVPKENYGAFERFWMLHPSL